MKNFLKNFGIIALTAVIGFSMIACGDPDDPEEPDEWSPVTNLSQLNGRWAGSGNLSQEYINAMNGNMEGKLAPHGNTISSGKLEWDFTINSATEEIKTHSYDFIHTISGSGLNNNDFWNIMESMAEYITINREQQTMTLSYTESDEFSSIDETFGDINKFISQFEINQNGKKIKYTMEIYVVEMILVKK